MSAYLIPAKAAETELTEKRSTFIGHVWPVHSEEEARTRIDEMRKKYHDARHNCWCYIIKDGPVRYSDDGEPQGTAGQPMLGVFQKEGVTNVCCVVTRYFGGVLLGAGGLVRAYTQSAKETLDRAGVSEVRRWVELEVRCPYSFLERVKQLCTARDGFPGEIEFGADVVVHALLPEENAAGFAKGITELSAGSFDAAERGEVFRPSPLKRK